MKIVVITGTEVKGCTYRMKEIFLENLRDGNEIEEFYLPRKMPKFCTGCKICFNKSETLCPHAEYTMPIWNSILSADLLVFAYPVYVMRAPGQVKALLDHFGCHWMVHRPEKEMFNKRAVILTQSIGAPNRSAQKDVSTSLSWLGVSDIKTLGFGTMGSVKWDEIQPKRREKFEEKLRQLSQRYLSAKSAKRSLKVSLLFLTAKTMHKALIKNQEVLSADSQHWLANGWIK